MITRREPWNSPSPAPWRGGGSTASEVQAQAETNAGLLDDLINCWSSILAMVLAQDTLPEEVQHDWRTRLVGLSFLDPQVKRLLDMLGIEIQQWNHVLGSQGAQLCEYLQELTQLCIEYQRGDG